MKREKALQVLGLDKARCSLTAEIVDEAFRKAVKANHPDLKTMMATPASNDPGAASWTIDSLKAAREALKINLTGEADFSCKLCNGVGMVRSVMGWRKCTACKGTGDKR